jgi:hypothetical protein
MTRRNKLLGAALALSLVVALQIGTAPASAARGLVTGFSDFSYTSPDPAGRSFVFDRTVQAGAGLVRLNMPWHLVAPSPPADPANPGSAAYSFGPWDAAVRDARSRGLSVLLTVLGAPGWAAGPDRPAAADPSTWKPSTSALAAFMQAVARRYSGGFDPDGPGGEAPLPAIQALQVWNEPNLPEYLTPQYQGNVPSSPGYYRQMLNASYAAVKAVNPSMLVVTGGTAPYGGTTAKGPRVRPVAFDRQLLCVRQAKGKKGKHRRKGPHFARLNGCGPAASFDVFAHHPINTSGPPTQHAFNRDDASSADLGRIARVLRAAEKLGTVSRSKHPIWATEMWWDSDPPNSAGSPLARQARWIEQALYLAWRDGASAVVNLLVRDTAEGGQSTLDGSGSGIYRFDGQPKPSAVAFRFPLVADRLGGGALRVWGKSPAAGKLVIQRRGHGRWVAARKLNVGAGAVFAVRLGLRGKQRLRARVAGVTSLVWKQA